MRKITNLLYPLFLCLVLVGPLSNLWAAGEDPEERDPNRLNNEVVEDGESLLEQTRCADMEGQERQQCIQEILNDDTQLDALSQTEVRDMNVNLGNNQAMNRLREYLVGRLNEYLQATEGTGGEAKVVDQEVFVRLYENQLSRNLINTMISYCMEADSSNNYRVPGGSPRDEQRRRDIRESRLQLLQQNAQSNPDQIGETHFNPCISAISREIRADRFCHLADPNIDPANIPYSTTRACELQRGLEEFRRTYAALANTKEQFAELRTQGQGVGIEGTSMNTGQGTQQVGQVNANNFDKYNEATTLTSQEYFEEAGMKEHFKEKAQHLQDCENNPVECAEEFHQMDDQRWANISDEYRLRTEVEGRKIASLDENAVKEHLKRQGLSDEDIEYMFQNRTAEEIRDDIAEKYRIERAALIASIRNKIKSQNTATDNATEIGGAQISDIRQEMEQRAYDVRNMLHYSNIVSGFISMEEATANNSGQQQGTPNRLTDTRALQREVSMSRQAMSTRLTSNGQNGFEETNRGTEYFDNFDQSANGRSPSGDNEDFSLTDQTRVINQLLGEGAENAQNQGQGQNPQ